MPRRVTPAALRKALAALPTGGREAFRRGGAIGLLRWRMRIRQRDLAALLGVHPVTVAKWEGKALEPDPWRAELLRTIAQASDAELQRYAGRLAFDGAWRTIFNLLGAADEEQRAND